MKLTKSQLKAITMEELEPIGEWELPGFRRQRGKTRAEKDAEFNAWAASKMRDAEERDEESHEEKMSRMNRADSIMAKIQRLMREKPDYYDPNQGGQQGQLAGALDTEMRKPPHKQDPDELLYYAKQIDPYGWS